MQRQLLDVLREWEACSNERQISMLWHGDYNLRCEYRNCRDSELLVSFFRFAIKRKYKDLACELWQTSALLQTLYSMEILNPPSPTILAPSPSSKVAHNKFFNFLGDYLRLMEMGLGDITSRIWNSCAALRRLLCNPIPPSANGWHTVVSHFENALFLGQQETVDAIWKKAATRLRIWYMCQEMNIGTVVKPQREKARIEDTIKVFKAAVQNQMMSIVNGMWLSCQSQILAYYEKRVENDEFYNEFCFYVQHGCAAIVKKLAQENSVFWRWFSGQSVIVPAEQTLRHFMMMLKLNDADLYMSFWNKNRFLHAAIRQLNMQGPQAIALRQLVLATGNVVFIKQYRVITQPVVVPELSEEDRREHKRKHVEDANPAERKRARLSSGEESSDTVSAHFLSSDQTSPFSWPMTTLFSQGSVASFDEVESLLPTPGKF